MTNIIAIHHTVHRRHRVADERRDGRYGWGRFA